jgi:hypothetical protein
MIAHCQIHQEAASEVMLLLADIAERALTDEALAVEAFVEPEKMVFARDGDGIEFLR